MTKVSTHRFHQLSKTKLGLSHGELEEDIYMNQPEGFVIPEKRKSCV